LLCGTISENKVTFNKSLKIPQGYSAAINQRIDNTMAKRKKDKQCSIKHYTETKIEQLTHVPLNTTQKTKIEQLTHVP
jgi:hypothetical protein